jgi:hypothetical protein
MRDLVTARGIRGAHAGRERCSAVYGTTEVVPFHNLLQGRALQDHKMCGVVAWIEPCRDTNRNGSVRETRVGGMAEGSVFWVFSRFEENLVNMAKLHDRGYLYEMKGNI